MVTDANGGVTARLPCPEGWLDKSMTVYAAPLAPGEEMAANIVVSRDALASGEDLVGYCERQIGAFRAGLPGFKLEERLPGRLGDRPAMRVQLVWNSAGGPLRQLATFVDAGSGVVVGYAASAPADRFDEHRALFDRQLDQLQISPAGPAAR